MPLDGGGLAWSCRAPRRGSRVKGLSIPTDVPNSETAGRRGGSGGDGARSHRRVGEQRHDHRIHPSGRHGRRWVQAGHRGHLPGARVWHHGRNAPHAPPQPGASRQCGLRLSYLGLPLRAAYCGANLACRGFFEAVRGELLAEGSMVTLSMADLPAVNTPQFDWCEAGWPTSHGRCLPSTSLRSAPTPSSLRRASGTPVARHRFLEPPGSGRQQGVPHRHCPLRLEDRGHLPAGR